MEAPRISSDKLNEILKKPGYGISTSISKSLREGAISSKIGSSRKIDNLEPDSSNEQVGSKRIQIKCSQKVLVRIKFYRRRLADYSRAISEKALIDCLQTSGLISGDSEKEIRLIDEGQEKVESVNEERTEITLEYPEIDFDDMWEESRRTDGR